MSEYQRYEFMTIDRPLTRAQLDAVNDLSSHIEASSTHAVIEYNWGDFKHDPIAVLREFFDGFLYWANWGTPQLAFRFPHGVLPANLLAGYDFDDFVTLTQHSDYDILDIQFGDMEAPDEWTDYELGSLIALRDELMEGDLRGLYIAWLASRIMIEGYDEEDLEEEDYEVDVPPVPPSLGTPTAAQLALVELLQMPQELLVAAAQHSTTATSSTSDDFAAWIKLLPLARQQEYLLRLAQNESGLSRLLVKELRTLGQDKTSAPPTGERVTYATLLTESKAVKARLAREMFEREEQERQRRMQEVHDHQEDYWNRVDKAAGRGIASGYDEALQLLIELRRAANHFKEAPQFHERFRTWIRPHMRRPALIKRLQGEKFPLPEA